MQRFMKAIAAIMLVAAIICVAGCKKTTFNVSVSANPTMGGSVTGGGTFQDGETCTVTATAKTDYAFANWSENDNVVSTEANYTFSVQSNRILVANFTYNGGGGDTPVDPDAPDTPDTPDTFTIEVSANPIDAGIVTGGGIFQEGETCTVSATADNEYHFINWTENDSVVSTETTYTFTVSADRSLVANFLPNYPIGAIKGKFTINDNGDQVYFSQGNLQYQASTNTWQFAANQYDYIGDNNSNISSSYSGWIDLFGWGTSGWNSGNTYYRPWDFDNSDGILYGPSGSYDLTGSYANADWGVYNAISNGGNQAGQWRTLTRNGGEWYYIFYTRAASTVNEVDNARFAKAKVADVHGIILFPDNYTHPSGVVQPVGINVVIGAGGWNLNDYSASDFALMQDAGAVFLPAAGYRIGTSVSGVGSTGDYWSASWYDKNGAFHVDFYDGAISVDDYFYAYRYYGRSVRLVCPAEN